MDNIDLTLRKFFASEHKSFLAWDDVSRYNQKYGLTDFNQNILIKENIFDRLGLHLGFDYTILHDRDIDDGSEYDSFRIGFTDIFPDMYGFGNPDRCDCCSTDLNIFNKSKGYSLCIRCDITEDTPENADWID